MVAVIAGTGIVSLTEAAAANGMAPTTLRTHCQQGRVVGAQRIGNRWALPAGALTILPAACPVGRPQKVNKNNNRRTTDLWLLRRRAWHNHAVSGNPQ